MQSLKSLPKERVKSIQEGLIALNLLKLPIDGIAGPNTHKAWAQFKRAAKHINLDKVGSESLADLAHAVKLARETKGQYVTASQAEMIFGRQITQDQLIDLNKCLEKFDITTSLRISHFLSQIAHETGGMRWLKELASGEAYEFRRNLGNVHQGDGVLYKGSGAFQLTGRANYQAFANYIKDQNVMQGCNYVASTYPFTSAGWYWKTRDLNKVCDNGASVAEVTKIINGGHRGLKERIDYFNKAKLIFMPNK